MKRFLTWLFVLDKPPGPDLVATILALSLVLMVCIGGAGLVYKNLIWGLDFTENATQLLILIVTSLVGVFAGYLGSSGRRPRR